jgi:4-hydroxy-tetrahydrodipicolinate synthase
MNFKPRGVIPAMVTPLNNDETIDEAGLRRLVNYLIDSGVHGLFAVGTQGEAYALSFEEKKRITEIVVDETRRRVPVYVGTGTVTTKEAIALTQMAEHAGVDAVSVITPFFITPSQNELYEHYAAIARNTRLPILLYPNPARTNVSLAVDTVVRLAQIENIVGIKDSSGDFTLLNEYLRRAVSEKFDVLVGRDTLIFSTLVCGGKGAIAATANAAPRIVAEIYNAFIAGDLERSRQAQMQLAPLRLAFELGTFPVVIKEALALMGICGARAKAPVSALADAQRAQLKTVLQEMKIL